MNDLLYWKQTNDEQPESGQLVLGRYLQISYGGDLYAYGLYRKTGDDKWMTGYNEQYIAAPEEWVILEVRPT